MCCAGGCLPATHAEVNGPVSVCFSAAAGKQAPSCWVTNQLCYRPLRGVPQPQRRMHSLCSNSCLVRRCCYSSTLQRYVAQKAVTSNQTEPFFCVLHGKLAPALGTVEQNKYQNITSIYINLLKSMVRLHLTVEQGLKHLGNNLHIMSTTTFSAPSLPFPTCSAEQANFAAAFPAKWVSAASFCLHGTHLILVF